MLSECRVIWLLVWRTVIVMLMSRYIQQKAVYLTSHIINNLRYLFNILCVLIILLPRCLVMKMKGVDCRIYTPHKF